MKLRDYLYFNHIQIKELAETLMIAPSYLSDISRGMRTPSYRLAKSIEEKTGGKVTAEEILNQKPIKKKKVKNGKD